MESPSSAWAAVSVFFLFFLATDVEGRLKIGTVGHTSSCGGYSTPWKCPYIAYENGQGCFEVVITTASECLAAAIGLGYSVRTIEEVYEDRAPSGCYVGEESDNWSNVFFNSHPTGIKHSKYRTICHNRVAVGRLGMGWDFDIGNGRGYRGVIRNVRRGGSAECCQKCWEKYPGTQMYGYNSSFKKCTCLYKNPGQTLTTQSVYNRQSAGLCAHEAGPSTQIYGIQCFDHNKDYPGNDMNLATVQTTELTENHVDCQALCNAKMGCNFFTWSSTNKRCYLKRKKSIANYEFGAISGPKYC